MIARSFALLAALLLASCSEAPPERDWPEASPALWEVTSPRGNKAWLFGTIHALPEGVEWSTPALEESLDEADMLVVEIADLGDAGAMQSAFNALAFTPGLGDYRERASAQILTQLNAEDATRGARFADDLEDWAVALQISSLLSEGEADNGVDRALLAMDKPRQGLESYASQFAMFDGLSPQAQAKLVEAVLLEEEAQDQAALEVAWLAGDLDYLASTSDAAMLAHPELREALLARRNAYFVAQILPLIAENREPFVAVGTAHMLYEDGLPALLAARGYQVTRIQ